MISDVITREQLHHQFEFCQNTDKLCCLLGGFGSGKTIASVDRSMYLLERLENPLYVVIAPTFSLLDDVNIPEFLETYNRLDIAFNYEKQKKKIFINEPGLEGQVWFRSADRPERIVGFNADAINIDEFDILKVSKQKELFTKCLGRLRRNEGSTLTFTTTPEGFKYTYQLFEKEKRGTLIRAATTDNPFLPTDYVETLYAQYDKQLVDQYVKAKFVNISGMSAYYAFDRRKHHKPANKEQIKNAPYIEIGMDFNISKMCAIVFLRDVAAKSIHFVNEIALKDKSTYDMADEIKARYPNHKIRIYPDATGGRRSTNASESDLAILRRAGFHVLANKINPFVRDRLNTFNGLLSSGRIMVDTDQCPELTQDLEQVVRTVGGDIDKSDPERTHASDAAGYPATFLYKIQGVSATQKRRF